MPAICLTRWCLLSSFDFVRKFFLTLFLALVFAAPVFSQSGEGRGYAKIVSLKNKLVNYLESIELKGVDTNYVGVPEKKWAVFTNAYLSQFDFDLRSNVRADEVAGTEGKKIGRVTVDLFSNVEEQVSVGLYFMGYGLSYSQDLSKGYQKDWSFTMYSSPVGGEFRYHITNKIHGKLAVKNLGLKFNVMEGDAKMENFLLNAYYVFSPKKFSYSSAMSYSKIQKKSAGSVLGGVTLNQTRITAYDPVLIGLMGGVNKIFLRRFSIGAGYAYNWVPVRGLTLHFSGIPMLLVTTKSATRNTDEEWSESQKETQENLFGSKTHISYNYMFRTSASYAFNNKFLAGFSGFYNFFKVGDHSSYYASNEDWSVRFFVTYRF